MIEKPINTCSKKSCNNCEIYFKITCHFKILQLLRFYAIASPSFILGGIGLYNYSLISFVIWFLIIGLFFLFIGIRVLCTHCPHYSESSYFLRCWVNYGLPKLWNYRPWPMSILEKIILISGFSIIWSYPVIFMLFEKKWVLLIGYIFFVFLFLILLRKLYCKKCINLSCPMNDVDCIIKEEFLKNNPLINNP